MTSRTSIVVALLAVLGGTQTPVRAETIQDGRTWINLNGQGQFHKTRWRWYFDVQNRTRGVSSEDQVVIRPGFGLTLGRRSSVLAGYAYTGNSPQTGRRFTEHRAWQQYLWTGPVASGTLSLRSRVEQRFFADNDHTPWRIRQQVRYVHPFKTHPSLGVVVWDEVLAHLNETQRSHRGFDQNRAFVGLNRALNPRVRIEGGYLNQFSHSTGPNKMHHILSGVVGLSF